MSKDALINLAELGSSSVSVWSKLQCKHRPFPVDTAWHGLKAQEQTRSLWVFLCYDRDEDEEDEKEDEG